MFADTIQVGNHDVLAAGLKNPAVAIPERGGTGGMILLSLFEDAGRTILIDAVEMNRAPRFVACLGIDEILSNAETTNFSLHISGILPPLQLARELGLLPPLLLYGIQPAIVAPGLGLSPPVNEALSKVLFIIIHSFRIFFQRH